MNRNALNIRKVLKSLFILSAPVLFAACGQSPIGPENITRQDLYGTVKSTVVLGKVGALRKGAAALNLQKLILTAVSTASPADTVRDTTAVSGNGEITLLKILTLKPLRSWTVSAKTLDTRDSVVHMGSTTSFYVNPADTVDVSLNLVSRFSMYEARFNSLPDSISSSASNTGKAKLNLNRVVLKVDGVVKADSVKASGYFSGNQSVTIAFDYITPGAHTVTLEAYGTLGQYSGILYSGSSTFTVAAGMDDTKAVTLNWVGPTTGSGKLSVVIGKVGKVVINGGLPGTVIN